MNPKCEQHQKFVQEFAKVVITRYHGYFEEDSLRLFKRLSTLFPLPKTLVWEILDLVADPVHLENLKLGVLDLLSNTSLSLFRFLDKDFLRKMLSIVHSVHSKAIQSKILDILRELCQSPHFAEEILCLATDYPIVCLNVCLNIMDMNFNTLPSIRVFFHIKKVLHLATHSEDGEIRQRGYKLLYKKMPFIDEAGLYEEILTIATDGHGRFYPDAQANARILARKPVQTTGSFGSPEAWKTLEHVVDPMKRLWDSKDLKMQVWAFDLLLNNCNEFICLIGVKKIVEIAEKHKNPTIQLKIWILIENIFKSKCRWGDSHR